MTMRDRWPMLIALTVSSLAVIATGITGGLAFTMGTQPAALTLGAIGIVVASAGLLAIIRWMLDAEEIYPDYRYRRAVPTGPTFLTSAITSDDAAPSPTAKRTRLLRPEGLGDNVVIFDLARARRKRHRTR
jgi:hypothetical protein